MQLRQQSSLREVSDQTLSLRRESDTSFGVSQEVGHPNYDQTFMEDHNKYIAKVG